MKQTKSINTSTSSNTGGNFTKKSKFTIQDIKDAQTYLINKHQAGTSSR